MFKFVSSAFIVLTCFTAGFYISSSKTVSNFFTNLGNVKSFDDVGSLFKTPPSESNSILDVPGKIKDIAQVPGKLVNFTGKFVPQGIKDIAGKITPDTSSFTDKLNIPGSDTFKSMFSQQSGFFKDFRDIFKSPDCFKSSWYCFKTVKSYFTNDLLKGTFNSVSDVVSKPIGQVWGKLTNKDTYKLENLTMAGIKLPDVKLPEVKLPNVLDWGKNITSIGSGESPLTSILGKFPNILPQTQTNEVSSTSSSIFGKLPNLLSKPQQPDTSTPITTTSTKSSIFSPLQNILGKGQTNTATQSTTTSTTSKPFGGIFDSKLNIFKNKNKKK